MTATVRANWSWWQYECMSRDSARDGHSDLHVRFAADPASVPAARRFVRDGLATWGRSNLVDDAVICVTELTSNAALHSAGHFFEVFLRALPGAVRVSVADEGQVPLEAIVPRRGRPPTTNEQVNGLPLDDEPTTGRGLVIVSTLARSWGIDETQSGKRIWADLADDGAEHPVRPPERAEPAKAAVNWQTEGLPDDWQIVRLERCPVLLSLRQDQHLDELIRELQLLGADRENQPSRLLAEVLEGLLRAGAAVRHTGRRIAQDAAEAGLELTDIDIAVPVQTSKTVQQLNLAVQAVDELCEEQALLTLASAPELRSLRNWMTAEFVRQIEQMLPPTTYADFVAQGGLPAVGISHQED